MAQGSPHCRLLWDALVAWVSSLHTLCAPWAGTVLLPFVVISLGLSMAGVGQALRTLLPISSWAVLSLGPLVEPLEGEHAELKYIVYLW